MPPRYTRPSARQRGYTARWERARRAYLTEHPLCHECWRLGRRVTAATVVDHIVPHRGDQALFWDESNWMALCKAHHDAKTAGEVYERKYGRPLPVRGCSADGVPTDPQHHWHQS